MIIATIFIMSIATAVVIGAAINYAINCDVYDELTNTRHRKQRSRAAHALKTAMLVWLALLVWPISGLYFLYLGVKIAGRFVVHCVNTFRSDLNATW